MIYWGLVLFALGIFATLDSQFNYGYIFRSANAILFLLVSLGVLIRSRYLSQLGFKEQLLQNNDELRARLLELTNPGQSEVRKETTQKVAVETGR